MWLFIQNQILGMQWLNEVVAAILQYVGVDVQSRIGGSLQFFFYDVVKITVLLCVLILLFLYPELFPTGTEPENYGTVPRYLGEYHGALLGTVTPFCSCSSIPLFIGFTSAGLPLGVTFSFLISSPMVDLAVWCCSSVSLAIALPWPMWFLAWSSPYWRFRHRTTAHGRGNRRFHPSGSGCQ